MKTVVTHSGTFHTDDVFAVAVLQLVYGVDALRIIRTRDEQVIARADIVVDVGGIYDPSIFRFDHHQNGAPVRDNGIPYAAFGLVWRTFGVQLCQSDDIASAIESSLVMGVDAGDSGITITEQKFDEVSSFDVARVIRSFAPPWGSVANKDEAFLVAVSFARALLERVIVRKQADAAMDAHVRAVYEQSSDKTVLYFETGVSSAACIDWPEVQIVVCPDENGNWTATAVRNARDTFTSRVQLPEAWAGLRDGELSTVSAIPNMVFCHKGRHFIVAKTRAAIETAVALVV